MKAIIILMSLTLLVFLAGCATPTSKTTTTTKELREDGTVWKEVTVVDVKYDNSTFYDGKCIGAQIQYDAASKSPTGRILYGRFTTGRVARGR